MRIDEEALRQRNQWKSLAEAPDLPFRSFAELQAALGGGSYTLDISYVAAHELAPDVQSYAGRLLNISLGLTPLLVVLASTIAAIGSGRCVVFFGVPLAVLGHALGNPLNPTESLMTGIGWLLAVATATAVPRSQVIGGALLAAFVVPFAANRTLYSGSVAALRKAVAASEPLFLNVYSKAGLRVRAR